MEKRGFHRWAWLVVFLLGGVLMLYGGAQDVAIFFSSDLAPGSAPRGVGLWADCAGLSRVGHRLGVAVAAR